VLTLLASPLSRGLFSGAMSLSGSPNVTMSAATQRRQHAPIGAAMAAAAGGGGGGGGCATKPAGSAAFVDCLRALPVSTVLSVVPRGPAFGNGTAAVPSWAMDNIFSLPAHADGLRMPGLAAVDGVLLRAPGGLVAAFGAGEGANVSLVVSSMAQECGAAPGQRMPPGSVSAFGAAIDAHFDAFLGPPSARVGERATALYAAELGGGGAPVTTQRAYDTMAADIEMSCGNKALALAAAGGRPAFKGAPPVYSVYNGVGAAPAWAFHGSDLAMATAGRGAAARGLRAAWLEFANTGAVAAWMPVDTPAGPASNVLGEDSGGLTSTVSVDNRRQQCAYWQGELGFGEAFWWSN